MLVASTLQDAGGEGAGQSGELALEATAPAAWHPSAPVLAPCSSLPCHEAHPEGNR